MKRWFKRWLCDFWYKKHEYKHVKYFTDNEDMICRLHKCERCGQRMVEFL